MYGVEQFLQTRSAIFIDRGQLVNIGVGVVAAVTAGFWLMKNLNRFSLDKVQVACILLILLSQASQFWTLSPALFATHFSNSIPYFVLFLLVAPIITQDRTAIRTGIWTTLYIGIPLVFLFVFIVEWDGRGIVMAKPVISRGRLTWTTPPLALSSMAAYVGMLCVIITPKNVLWKLVHIVTFALACYVAFRTQSRGQLLALGFVTMVCYPLANQATKFKGLLITMAGFTVLVLALYLVFTQLDLGNMNRWTENSIRSATEGRFGAINVLLTKWINSGPFQWMFGLGSASSFALLDTYPHNLPAEVLGELGLVGAAIFAFIYYQTGIKSIRIIQKLEHYPDMRREAIALIALFMFSSIISLKQGSLFSWPHLFFFAIAISHLEIHSRSFVAERLQLRRLFLRSAAMSSASPGGPEYKPQYQ